MHLAEGENIAVAVPLFAFDLLLTKSMTMRTSLALGRRYISDKERQLMSSEMIAALSKKEEWQH